MKNTLYLMLVVTLIIGVVGVVRISSLFRKNLLELEGNNGYISTAIIKESIADPKDRIKRIIRPKGGNGDILTNLPCFQCHKIQSWVGVDGPASFPHTFHIAMELHCLDCHTFVAHGDGMSVDYNSCTWCHE